MSYEDYELEVLGRRCHARLPQGFIPWLRYEYEFGYDIPLRFPDIAIAPLASALEPPQSPAQVVRIPGQTVDAYPYHGAQGEGYLLQLHDSQLLVEQAQHRLSYYSQGQHQGLMSLIGIGLNELLRHSGWLPLHASVAVKGERVLAFLGPSGRGKSTTLLTALQRGYKALNEDTCWLPPDSTLLYGWDRGFHLLPDAYTRFAEALEGIPSQDITVVSGDKKRLLWRDLLARELVVSSPVQLSHLVWLERPTDFLQHPSRWQPISKRQAALGMWEAVGISLNPETGQRIASRIPELLQAVACRKLFIGNTPLPFDAVDTLDAVDTHLEPA